MCRSYINQQVRFWCCRGLSEEEGGLGKGQPRGESHMAAAVALVYRGDTGLRVAMEGSSGDATAGLRREEKMGID